MIHNDTFQLPSSSRKAQSKDIIDIIEYVEDVIVGIDSDFPQPTPIAESSNGQDSSVRVVDKIDVSDNSWYQDRSPTNTLLTDLLQEQQSMGNVVFPSTVESCDFDQFLSNSDEEGRRNEGKSAPPSQLPSQISRNSTASFFDSKNEGNQLFFDTFGAPTAKEDEWQEEASVKSSDSSLTSQIDKSDNKFRQYQEEQWKDRFQELKIFKAQNGHCSVPHNFPQNPQLAQWVKRQRYQYKLKKRQSKHSTLTDEREVSLENLGFVWDSHKAAWYERFEALKLFKAHHGHCDVPSKYFDRQLAVWVKCQRRQFKATVKGNGRSQISMERIQALQSLGFRWNPRNL